ncbi:hypothetical protein ZWY2020_028482 [Hordeum vulgare]|nr:hypothetical protein ZWY2020_028482 [Hordeum vulgare]
MSWAEAPAARLILYSYKRSSGSHRVCIALNLKEFMKLNPMKFVPAWVDGDELKALANLLAQPRLPTRSPPQPPLAFASPPARLPCFHRQLLVLPEPCRPPRHHHAGPSPLLPPPTTDPPPSRSGRGSLPSDFRLVEAARRRCVPLHIAPWGC